jgi:hypothetical protein
MTPDRDWSPSEFRALAISPGNMMVSDQRGNFQKGAKLSEKEITGLSVLMGRPHFKIERVEPFFQGEGSNIMESAVVTSIWSS